MGTKEKEGGLGAFFVAGENFSVSLFPFVFPFPPLAPRLEEEYLSAVMRSASYGDYTIL